MSQKIKTSVEIDGSLKASQIANATTDTDKFLVSDSGTVKYRTGAEVLSDLGITVNTASKLQHQVKAGVAINKGQAVYVTSADGTNMIVGLASNASEATSSKTMGLLDGTVAINGFANVVTEGLLAGLSITGAVSEGDPVWLGTGGNLIYGLANKPSAPNHLVFIGIVTRVNDNNGEIFVKVQNGFELNEIHDVDLKTNIPIGGDVLGYNGSLWVNKTIPGWLGYAPANDANVVKLTGNQTINGEKTFAGTIYSDNATYLKQYSSFSNQTDYTNISGQPDGIYIGTISTASTISMTNLTAFRFYELPDASGTIALTSDIAGYVPYTGATSNVNLGSYSITANSFIKVGGNSTQYLKADGSVSTAMNSRIEVNFIATAGQTTFVTPYEVGQIDVYYNGSKLYPNEFTATNGTDIILATGATLNAQISIVKYVSSLSTTAIRNETTFTTTAGQTTFAVNYSPGQVDVFYNGSKLNISEFTATNGTSVVLGFACAAGESVVMVSYVNQISGASGTTNYVAKFTGGASLGNSLIYDNGINVGIGTTSPSTKLTIDNSANANTNHIDMVGYSSTAKGHLGYFGNNIYLSSNYFYSGSQNSDTSSLGQAAIVLSSGTTNTSFIDFNLSDAGSSSPTNKMRINSVGNVGIGTHLPISGGSAGRWLTLNGTSYSGGVICSINDVSTGALYSESGYFNMQASSGYGIKLFSNGGEALKIDTSGRVTTPQMPSFRAWYSINATWTLASNATFNFDVTEYNVGGCYNVSNGIFTAPVAGVYQFNFYTIVLGTYVNAAISFRKNGGIPTSGYNVHFSPTSASNWSNVVYTTSMYLNAGDYVNMINNSGFSVNFHGKDWSSFSGYLVG